MKITTGSNAAPALVPGRRFLDAPLLLALHAGDGGSDDQDLLDHLANEPLDNSASLTRARNVIDWLDKLDLCTFYGHESEFSLPPAPYVLVLDQSARATGGPTLDDMREMLVFARTDNINAHVVILGATDGFFTTDDAGATVTLLAPHVNPWHLFRGATAVYCHSTGAGFDALLAGHRPRVFGQPWYGGWGLTDDQSPDPTRSRRLTRAQITLAALIDHADWHDASGNPAPIEDVLAATEAQLRAARADANGYVATNILPWKRRFMRQYFGATHITFTDDPDVVAKEIAAGRTPLHWGNTDADVTRIEDGFLRSKGLGAALVRPLSLVSDDLGLYFDPTRPSRLENLIETRAQLPDYARARIDTLLARIQQAHLSKYNVGTAHPDLPVGHRILVAGQVDDDASIRFGAGEINTNRALLQAARAANPQSVIVYKPHPDVEAGLRRGKIPDAETLADVVATNADPIALIEACDEVWSMTSLIGFEALLRRKPVTCTGAPFYAGWGLTRDIGNVPARRGRSVDIAALAYATLIDYPRYFHPETGAPLSPEQAVTWLESARAGRSKPAQRALAIIRQLRARFLGLSD
ncbi:capsular polysaccharide biosynthesis protein [Celeribacter arenosi]|uniref:Capsular polysaccharide biosynthesis protein n=1 Tax=Celeribacter arenosi TaxID=792649 RepID=A0ABP7JT77_9RHOB